jgi:hypothetical protein
MSTKTMSTTLAKNRTTDRDRAFWSHIESVAEQSRNIRERSTSQRADLRDEVVTHRDELDHRGEDKRS